MVCPLLVSAQKKQISTAKDLVRAGKDLTKAEKSMRILLSDSANHYNVKAWVVLCDALTKQYEQGNEKLYLKQKYDTAAFFKITKRMFETMASFDSIDARIDTERLCNLNIGKNMPNCSILFVQIFSMEEYILFIQKITKLLSNILIITSSATSNRFLRDMIMLKMIGLCHTRLIGRCIAVTN